MNNIFDKESFNINEYPFSPSAKGIVDEMNRFLKPLKIALLVLICILAILLVSFKISITEFYCYSFAVMELFIGLRSISRVRASQRSLQFSTAEKFDLYLYQFHKTRKRNKRAQDKFMLYMAKEDIAAGNFDRAAAALSYIDPSKLKGYYKKLYSIISYSLSLRCADFATAEKMFNEYSKNVVTADQTFPDPGELWNWRNGVFPERVSQIVASIKNFNEGAGIATTIFTTISFTGFLVALANDKLSSVPLEVSNTALIYCIIMMIFSFLCIISTIMLLVVNKGFLDKSGKAVFVLIAVVFTLCAVSWGIRTLVTIGEWLLLWM